MHNMTFNIGGYRIEPLGSELTDSITLAGVAPQIKVTPGGETAQIVTQLTGTAGMNKTGAGILIIGANATYTGGTTVSEGTLLLNFTNRLPTDQAITLTGTGLLDVGGVTQSTSAAISFTGGSVTNGTLIKSGAAYDAQSGSVTEFGHLDGTAGLTMPAGAGTMTIGGTCTYDGGTTINGGILQLAIGADRLPTDGAITVNTGGTLNLGTFTQNTSGIVIVNGGTISNGTLKSTSANIDARSGTISAALDGAFGITKTTADVLTVSGNSPATLVGKSTISEGVVVIGNGNFFGVPAALVADQITMAGGTTLRVASGTQTMATNAGITLTGNITFNVVSGALRTIAITGNGGVTVDNGGWQPTGACTYTGDTVLSGFNMIRFANALPFGAGKGNLYLNTGATLSLNSQSSLSINGLFGTGTITNDGGSGTTKGFSFGNGDASGDFSGTLKDNDNGLRWIGPTKVGTGTQILRGPLTL